MSDQAQRIEELEKRIAELERKAAQPIITPMTPIGPGFLPPLPPPIEREPFRLPLGISQCGRCGIVLSPVMGYVCNRADCPTGLAGPTCNAAAEVRP